jgi:hypothetical protein
VVRRAPRVLRSGAESHYVVLTRLLQIGVMILGALILAAFAFAGYSAIAGRFAAIEQRREIARLRAQLRRANQRIALLEARADPGTRALAPADQHHRRRAHPARPVYAADWRRPGGSC